MSRRKIVMALGKVIIAAAWADHHLSTEEVNSLKKLLLRVPIGTGPEGQLTAAESAELDVYLHSPVGPQERARLIADLGGLIASPRDRETAMTLLDDMIRADGVVTPEERAVREEVQRALDDVGLGIGTRLARLFGVGGRPASGASPRREDLIGDYLNNRIYFALRQRLAADPSQAPSLDDAALKRLCLAAGLMAWIAGADGQASEREWKALSEALAAGWGLSSGSAALLAETALAEVRALELFQLTNAFRTATEREERLRLLQALFAVATAEGSIGSEESDEISRISSGIGLTSSDFSDAKARARG